MEERPEFRKECMRSFNTFTDESGTTLIEVVVSAVLLVIVSLGVLSAVEAASHSSGEERHRAQAHGIAQEDQARMRAMNINDLANLNQTRTVTRDGSTYTVVSRGDYVTDSTGTATCTPGTASADYIKTTSTVTWPTIGSRPPVVTEGIVAPPSGSVSPDRGGLAITVMDSRSVGIPGVGLSGTGAGSFGGSTGPTGCALFGNLPEGNYTLTPSMSSGVDKDGNPPGPQPTSVLGQATNTVVLQYDNPGSVSPITFQTRDYSNTLVPANTDTVMLFHTGMTQARRFGTPGTNVASVNANSLFPFTSPYTLYPGNCTGNNPDPGGTGAGGAADATATVPVGGNTTLAAPLQLPALHLTVWSGSSSSSPGSQVVNARVRIDDDNCGNFMRTYFTNALGQLDNPALPYSTSYDICANNTTSPPSSIRRQTSNNRTVTSLSSGLVVNLYLQGSGSSSGTCP